MNQLLDFKSILSIAILFSLISSSYTQTLPNICPQPAYMTKNCIDACLICDIDGFTGRNTSRNDPGQKPPGFCTSVNHNIRWIAFMASSPQLTLEFSVRNCMGNQGLEVGIYESLDCNKFQLVSNCEGGVFPNTSKKLTFTKTIVEGQYYYLVIDGNSGDVCDYSLKVVNGSTKVSPLDKSGEVSGPLQVCQGDKVDYNVTFIKGATWHFWYLNGSPLGVGNIKQVEWKYPGKFQLCAQAVNACDDAPSNCIEVYVAPKYFTDIDAYICQGETYNIGNKKLNTEGIHTVILPSVDLCDSTLRVNLKVGSTNSYSTRLNLCEGDTIILNNKKYFSSGIFEDILKNSYGCDSILELEIISIQCLIQSRSFIRDARCFGENNGSITFEVINGTPPFIYQYENVQDLNFQGVGQVPKLNELITINNLPAGHYQITITDVFGNKRIMTVEVHQPETLELSLTQNVNKPYSLKCYGDQDGFINTNVSGGTGPYTYLWSNQSSQSQVKNIRSGTYTVTVLDANQCPIIEKTTITQPDSLDFLILSQDPSCIDNMSGEIDIANFKGGVSPYKFSFNNQAFENSWQFRLLTEGIYNIVIKDDNGCLKNAQVKLTNPEHISLKNNEEYVITLGDSTRFKIQSSGTSSSYQWIPSDHLSCFDCVDPIASPLSDTYYTLLSTSKDGCIDTISVLVRVIKDKRIWAPNIFSPNGDGINDNFIITGTKPLSNIRKLSIFDRWGGLVFQGNNLQAHDNSLGWRGFINNEPALPGVYTWTVEAEFLDGDVIIESGDLTLVR